MNREELHKNISNLLIDDKDNFNKQIGQIMGYVELYTKSQTSELQTEIDRLKEEISEVTMNFEFANESLKKKKDEIDRLKAALDFNVKENINILRQFSESIEENKRLKAENEELKKNEPKGCKVFIPNYNSTSGVCSICGKTIYEHQIP